MEYARNAVRLAALVELRNILVYTHDSVAVGEDGPTQQPIEQLTNLRTTPGRNTWRPSDTVETAVAWRSALTASGPSSLVLTRQKTQPMPHDGRTVAGAARGGYVLVADERRPALQSAHAKAVAASRGIRAARSNRSTPLGGPKLPSFQMSGYLPDSVQVQFRVDDPHFGRPQQRRMREAHRM